MGTVRKIMPADRESFATRRQRQHQIDLDLAVAHMGEDAVIALLEALRNDSEAPLSQLPASAWRDGVIAEFRVRRAGRKTAEILRLK